MLSLQPYMLGKLFLACPGVGCRALIKSEIIRRVASPEAFTAYEAS